METSSTASFRLIYIALILPVSVTFRIPVLSFTSRLTQISFPGFYSTTVSTVLQCTSTPPEPTSTTGPLKRDFSNSWSSSWFPLTYTAYTDKKRPTQHYLLGAPIVVWHHNNSWHAMLDKCPHRLAVLSEGRVVPISGNIECPYHGWTFEGSTGKCTGIPQAEPNATLFDSESRGCATALRCHVHQGILWVYSSPLYQDNNNNNNNRQSPNVSDIWRYNIEPIDRPGVLYIDYFRDLPMEWSTLAENVLDPSHLPFTHHKTISSREKASPVLLRLTGPITAQGFHVNKTQGSVEFRAPHLIFSTTSRGKNSFDDWNVVYAVPTLPGRCRLLVRVVFEVSAMKPPLKWIFSLAFRQPGFLLHLNNHKILEDDNIFLHYQGHNYRALESFEKGTYLPTRADVAVIAFQRWLKEYESERTWSLHTPSGSFLARDQVLPRDALIERRHAHTESCSICLKARRRLEQVDSVFGVGAILCAIGAVGGSRVRWSVVLMAGILYALKQKAGRMRRDMETGMWPPPRNQ